LAACHCVLPSVYHTPRYFISHPFFLLSCHTAHPHLHSFPTRRSSDLVEDLEFPPSFVMKILTYVAKALGSARKCSHSPRRATPRSEEHTSELQSRFDLVCRLLLEKKNYGDHRHAVRGVIRTETLSNYD